MNTEANPMFTGEDPVEELLSVTDRIFELFKLQPTSSDWPAEVQGIAAHLERIYKYQKLLLLKSVKKQQK